MQRDGTHHNALDDATAQALHLMEMLGDQLPGRCVGILIITIALNPTSFR